MVCSVITKNALRVVAAPGAGACACSCATPAVSTAPIAMPARRVIFIHDGSPLCATRPLPSKRVRTFPPRLRNGWEPFFWEYGNEAGGDNLGDLIQNAGRGARRPASLRAYLSITTRPL